MTDLEFFLNNSISILKEDLRFLGIAVAGSWITGNTDKFSDLDLIVVCTSKAYQDVMIEKTTIAKSLGDLLAGFTGEHVGEPRLLICLYNNPVIHVDLKFIKLSDLETRIENPFIVWERDHALSSKMAQTQPEHHMPNLQWIEDRFWVWIHYAATKLGRGELFEVIDFLSYLRSQVLGPLSLSKHGQLPRGVRRLETLAIKDFNDFKKTIPSYDKNSCLASINATINLYTKLREELDDGKLNRKTKAEQVSIKYLEQLDI